MLNGVGSGNVNTLYNCFVIGVEPPSYKLGADSRLAIMETVTRMIEITARGGGVGINWSCLRPAGSYIKGVNGYSSGSVSWMMGADGMINSIRQGGTRTAALMFILDDWHPDVLEFADTSFSRANHSVAISAKFMNAVKDGSSWAFKFPDTSHPDYNIVWTGDIDDWEMKGYPVIIKGEAPARDIWDHFCECAARTGNPGMVFLERANILSNTGYMETLTSTNPCGEQLLPVNGSCNLGAVNLVAHWSEKDQDIDRSALRDTISKAIRMMDRVIDVSEDIDEEIALLQRKVRRVGMGTMGLADLLLLKRIRYGSEESLHYIDNLYEFICASAYHSSISLAKEFGAAPALDKRQFLAGCFISGLDTDVRAGISQFGIRNLTLISQAPTGTTSILAGVSSGIEPLFAADYIRRDATGESRVTHPAFQMGEGDHLVTSMDIPVEEHIAVQSVIQHHSDNAISKTVNLPEGSSASDVSKAYHLAYDLGCKGITVYVAGSREGVLEVDCPTGACEI